MKNDELSAKSCTRLALGWLLSSCCAAAALAAVGALLGRYLHSLMELDLLLRSVPWTMTPFRGSTLAPP